jgi:hypothetical protein
MFWEEEPSRKPVPIRVQKKVLLRCKGKCENCGLDFNKRGVKPHIHHIDGNPKHNKASNLIVVCPNCHTKLHKWKTVKEEDAWGFVREKQKLVAIKPKKVRTTKKKPAKKKPKNRTKAKRTKRKKKEESIWDLSLL